MQRQRLMFFTRGYPPSVVLILQSPPLYFQIQGLSLGPEAQELSLSWSVSSRDLPIIVPERLKNTDR